MSYPPCYAFSRKMKTETQIHPAQVTSSLHTILAPTHDSRPTGPTSPTRPTGPIPFTPSTSSTPKSPAIPQIPQIPSLPLHRNNPLSKLTPDQRAQLDTWLFIEEKTYPEIRTLLLENYNIRTSPAALCRYYQRQSLLQQLEDAAELSAAIPDVQASMISLLQQQALHAAANSQFDPRVFNALTRFYRAQLDAQHRAKTQTQRDRHLELINKRIELETFKAQYNAARITNAQVAQIQQVQADHTRDHQDHNNQTRQILFGQNCVPTPPYPNSQMQSQFPVGDDVRSL